TFLDAVASAAQAVAAAGASGTDGSRGSGLAPNNGAPQCNGNCDTLGSSDWEVCDGCTKGTSYGSYYDEDGVYHSGAKYDKSRDDNNLEIKIPGTNFAWRECDGNARYYYDFCGLTVYDPEGIKLTTAGFDPVTLLKVIDRFGIPIEQLNTVADYFDAEGIGYLPYELTGFGEGGGNAGNAGHYASDHGIDLRDLADGGLGTAYDWRLDNCDAAAAVPGFAWTKDGCERAADEDRAIAEKWGLTANDEVTTGVTVEEIHKNTGAWCDKPDDQLTADIYRESYGIGGWNHNGLQVDYESEKCAWLREPMGTPI
ncbi:MAG TPA: hypothetical protein VHO23_02265, partial [Candidatus Paceibacterota bacterium]|nr:hypothetical protein [Candidatus Paceibacterota bacterium]